MRQLSFIVTYMQALFKQEISLRWRFTRAIRKAASSTLSAASQICYRTITNASRRSHCGGSESCRLRDPPQAKNPAKQDLFLLIRRRSLCPFLRSDFHASRLQERTGELVYDVKIVLKTLKRGRKIHRKSTGDYKMMYFKFFSEGKKFYIIKEAVLYDA